MITTDFYITRNDGVNLYITQSDAGHYIIQDQTGTKYESAIDIEGSPYTYTESDEVIPVYDEQGAPFPNPYEISPEEVVEALEEII